MMKLVVSNMEHLSENHRRRPSPSLYVGLAWPASVLISVLAIGQLVAASSSLATTNSNNRVADIKIENGWHEVREGWPTQDKDFFIATEKGHHYVEAQLPKNLKQDVMVSFEYYYSYAKTRPVLQLTPCRQNIYLVNENSDDQSNRWIKHTYRVKHSDCNARNKLAYNALLHDAGDVFAWKKMEIEYLPEGEASSAAPVNPNPVTTDKSTDVENEVAINDGSTDQVDTKKDTDTPKGTESAKSDEELYEEQADTQQEPKGAEERPKEAGPKERPKEEGPKERPEEEGPKERPEEEGPKERPEEEGPKERPEEEGPKERPEEEGPKERTEEEGPKERPEGEGPKERQEEEGPKETPNVDETAAAEKPTTSETESGQDKPATPSDERSGPQDSKAPQTNEERPKSPPPPPPPPKPQGSSSKVEWNTDKATTTTATTTTKVDSGSFQSEPEKTRPKVVKKIPADLKSPGDSSNPSSSKKDEPKPIEERTDSKVDSSKSSSDAESTSKVTTSTNNDYDDDQLINAAEISREEADKDPANGRPGMMRRKRSAKVAKSGAELKNKNKLLVSTDKPSNLRDSCKPSSCNRDKFRMSRFSGLINGLPWIPDKMKVAPFRYYVNLRNQPLKMRIRSFDQSLDEVDTCVNFWLYMEKDTKLEFLLENSSDPKREKLLELIERKAGDSTASHWDEFTRCISDYMPKYVSSSSASSHENTFDTLKFVLKPVKGQRPGQLVVLVNQNEVASFHELSRVQSHLPDLKRIADSKELERYWVFDRDGLKKVRMDLLTEKGLPGGRKVLRVSRIDPTQKYFDITSRWLRIKDAEILEHPVTFVYKAEQVDWIEQIDFQYQSVDDSEWRTHVAYLSSSREKEIEKEKAAAAAAKATNSKEAAATGDAGGNNAPAKPAETGGHDGYRFIDLPINLKHADSSEFRVRVRHYLKQKASPNQVQSSGSESGSGDLSLFIRSLAFADVCSYNNMVYCKNNGECKPTGAAQAECFCKPGYSGRYCEQVKPCEVHYGPGDSSVSSSVMGHREQMDGHQICKSLGAQCIDQLPVMRCEWPNDEYYECKKLFKFDSRTGLIVPGHKPSPGGTDGNGTGPGESSDDDSVLREKVKTLQEENNQQAKLIIILGVFLVALMVFAVVLIGSMVSRLRVSSGRLKKSQNEMHELARRVQPRGGGFSGSQQQQIGSVSRGGIAYNNSAFDVEL